MQCTKPVRITKNLNRSEYPDGLLVPCGKCLHCRIAKRKEWSMRMLHELGNNNDAVFVTLTYDNKHLPENNSLVKADLQKFFKRLRMNLIYKNDKRKIRYFACGEYGDETQRPHYHAIIFNMSPKTDDQSLINISWNKGFCHFGIAEKDSIRYVAQYIDKKYTGDLAEIEYKQKNREPVFRILSLGLGREYVDKNSESISRRGYVTVNGIPSALPRYYINRLNIENDELKNYSIDKEIKIVKQFTGHELTRDEAYRLLKPDDVVRLEEGIKKSNEQKELNSLARINLKKSKI